MTKTTKIAIFKGLKIRKVIHDNEWWFVVEDVVIALTDSPNPKDYINKMRLRDNELSNQFHLLKQNLLRNGWQKLDMKESKK